MRDRAPMLFNKGAISVSYDLQLCKFCSPFVSFFWFVPGFVEGDEVVPRLDCIWMRVTEFEAAAFEGFE